MVIAKKNLFKAPSYVEDVYKGKPEPHVVLVRHCLGKMKSLVISDRLLLSDGFSGKSWGINSNSDPVYYPKDSIKFAHHVSSFNGFYEGQAFQIVEDGEQLFDYEFTFMIWVNLDETLELNRIVGADAFSEGFHIHVYAG